MLIEQIACTNRWRAVTPAAKGLFAAAGLVAVFAAGRPSTAALVAGGLALLTVLGAGIPVARYLRVAAPALLFLALGSLSLLFSLDLGTDGVHWRLAPDGLAQLAATGARSLGALAALLFLVLTTPLNDLLGVLRRLKAPELLLDLMLLCYRTLFVFSAAAHDTLTAQAARLGYATPRLALRSLGSLAANLTLQVWQRAAALHLAAQARNNDGPLLFLTPEFADSRRHCALAGLAGLALIGLVVGLR